MKKFNKFLALMLTLITVVAALPFGAFADAWVDLDAKTEGTASTVTLTLDAAALAAILEKDGISPTLLQDLKAGVSVDVDALKEAFTVAELLEIIPRDAWLKIFNVEEIVEAIGLDTLMKYVDIPALLADVETAKLAELIKKIPALESYVDAKALLQDKYISTNLIIKHMYEDKLLSDLDVALLKKAVLEDANLTVAELKELVDTDKIVKDGKIDVDSVLDKDATAEKIADLGDGFEQYVTDKNLLKSKIQTKYPELATLLNANIDKATIDALNEWKDYVTTEGKFDYEKLLKNDKITIDNLLDWGLDAVELYNDKPDLIVFVDGAPAPGSEGVTNGYINNYLDKVATKAKILADNSVSFEDYIDTTILKNNVTSTYPALNKIASIDNLEAVANAANVWKAYVNTDGSVNFKELFKQNKINASEMLTWGVLDTDLLLKDNIVVVDESKVVTEMNGVDGATLKGYVKSMTKALDVLIGKLGLDYCVGMLGGYEKATNYINITALVAELDLAALINSINANPDAKVLADYVDLNGIMKAVSMGDLLNLVPMNVLFAQLDNNELIELVQLINVKQYIRPVLSMVADKLLLNIDKVAIDGNVVASENAVDGLLNVNASALVKAVAGMIPGLNEFASVEDGKYFTTTVDLTYTVDGTATQKTKSVTFELVVEGDLSRLQNAAAKLSDILHTYINKAGIENGVVILDVTVPSKLTALYARALELDAIPDELKVKVLDLVNLDGDKVEGFVGALTFEEIITILDAVEPSALYNTVLNHEYVALVLDKIEAKFGYDLTGITLDELVNKAANIPSAERISEIIENKTGKNVLAYVETLAIKADAIVDKAEKITAVQKILDKIEGRFGIDLSAISAADIVDRAKDAPISETVSNIVAAKIGVDVRAILDAYTVDELYQKAVDKAATKTDAYNKVKNYILAKAELIPDRAMNICLADAYEGNGVFATGSRSVTFNAKELVRKALDKVLGKLNLDTDAIAIIMDRINGGESITVGFDFTVRFQNLYQIKYMARDAKEGDEPLFSAFLPEGADLNVFKNNPGVTGYEFKSWTDAEGNALLTMPGADTVVYADRNFVEVKFENQNGDLIGTILMESGDTLAMHADAIAEIAKKVTLPTDVNEKLYDGYRVGWTNKEDANERLVFSTVEITEDTTLVAKAIPNYFLSFDAEVDYDVTEKDGAYVLTVNGVLPESFNLNLDRAHLLTRANGTDVVSLTMHIADGDYDFLKITDATLADLYNRAKKDVVFAYAAKAGVTDAFADTYYAKAEGAKFYTFDILADGTASHDKFAEAMAIKLPYAGAIVNKVGEKTNVYTVADGVRELAEAVVETAQDGTAYVAFKAAHFSDYVIANEVLLTLTFKTEAGKNVDGKLAGFDGSLYFPAGTQIKLAFEVPEGYKVIKIEANNKTYNENDLFTIEGAVTVNVTLREGVYYIYYYVNGKLTATQEYEATDKNVALKSFADVVGTAKPTDTTKYAATGAWIGFDTANLGKADMMVYAKWDLISYTVIFQDQTGKELKKIEGVTAENYAEKVTAPAIPEVAGKAYKWGTPAISGTTATVKAVEAGELIYSVITDGNVTAAPTTGKYGAEITLTPVAKDGYTAKLNVVDANGKTVAVTNNKIKMPASNVYVTVTYEAKPVSYTINGTEGTGTYGDTVEFTVTVNNGEILATAPAGCELVKTETDKSGKKTLTYAFVLDADNKAISYKIDSSALTIFKIFNGKLFEGEGEPESTVKNVAFAAWSETVAGTLQFATFLLNKTTSLLWLWILLAVLVLIALIILIYLLHITGKIGVNFLTRFVCWIVGGFFAICLALSGLVLKILGKDEEELGFEKETASEEATEEAAEEATEEVAEEATEEVAEGATEEVAEEATEEVAKEATEEVAEEATEEVAEEATEEVAEEATEEAAEEATEEVAEEATEEVAEEATEEAAEEATEEAKKETTKEKKDNQ